MVQLLDEFVQVISTKADTRGFDVLDRKQKRAINNTSILSKSFSRMFGFIGGALALNSLKNYADEWTNIESTLRLVSGTEEERLRVEEKLFDISQRTRQSMSSNVDLYRNMSMATEKLNISEENRLKIVETIGKSLAIGGGGSAAQQAALVQFGQALSMGRLRAQEMNSIISQTPRLGKALAAGMGMTLKEFREASGKGKITPEKMLNAILSQTEKINAEFRKMKPTIGQALTTLNNSFGKLISRTEKAGSLTETIAKNIERLATAISSPKVVNSMKLIGILIKGMLDNFKLLVGFYMFRRFMKGEIFKLFLLNLKDGAGLVKALSLAIRTSDFAILIKSGAALALSWGKFALILALAIEALETLQGKDSFLSRFAEMVGGKAYSVVKGLKNIFEEDKASRGILTEKVFQQAQLAQNALQISMGAKPYTREQYFEKIGGKIPTQTFAPTNNFYITNSMDENLLSQKVDQVLDGQFTRFNMKQGFTPIR